MQTYPNERLLEAYKSTILSHRRNLIVVLSGCHSTDCCRVFKGSRSPYSLHPIETPVRHLCEMSQCRLRLHVTLGAWYSAGTALKHIQHGCDWNT